MRHKVLLLGLGFWGNFWIKLIEETDKAILAGIAGSQAEINKATDTYSIENTLTFTDYKKAIAECDADIAVIVIPAILHADAAMRAMKKGMNIIMEKPLSMNLDEARMLLNEKTKHPSLKFMSSQNYRWRPHNQAIKNAVKKGLIGDLESISVEFRKQEDLQGYRAGLEKPLLQDVCIHHFDLIRFFTDSDCEELFCTTYRPSWSAFDGYPNTDAVMRMQNGIRVVYNGSWAARGMESSWDGNITLTGSKGTIKLRADNSVTFYPHLLSEIPSFEPTIQEGELLDQPEMEFTEMAYGFHMLMNCIEQGAIPETTIEDNFKSFTMVAKALESAESGKQISC